MRKSPYLTQVLSGCAEEGNESSGGKSHHVIDEADGSQVSGS